MTKEQQAQLLNFLEAKCSKLEAGQETLRADVTMRIDAVRDELHGRIDQVEGKVDEVHQELRDESRQIRTQISLLAADTMRKLIEHEQRLERLEERLDTDPS